MAVSLQTGTPFWIAVQAEAKSVVAHNAFQEITALCWYQCPYSFDTTSGRDERAVAIRQLFKSNYGLRGGSGGSGSGTGDYAVASNAAVSGADGGKGGGGSGEQHHLRSSHYHGGTTGHFATATSPYRDILHYLSPFSHAVFVAMLLSLMLPLVTLYRCCFCAASPFLKVSHATSLPHH